MDRAYWIRQTADQPLFPDIEWSKPEQKSHAGRLGIIGGNSLGFAAVAESYQTALKTGAGMARILLPDVLKKNIPTGTVEVIYGPSNPSGGLAREAITEMKALSEWATGILMIGDAGRNSETAILYEEFIKKYDGPLIVARDAVDLTTNDPSSLIERPNTVLVLSFAQLQRIFKNAYYPIVITFSMQITNLVEALHKFTVTYPITIVAFHNDTIIVAQGGNVTTTPWNNPMAIWRGITPTIMASYWLWNPSKPLESITASLLNN